MAEKGLILIQIDGLSRRDFERARRDGRLSFIDRYLREHQAEPRPFYSGLPSSTPAVQGELFFGSPRAVPAFAFYDREHDKLRRMYQTEDAGHLEDQLNREGEALLEGGSAYADIYTGGARHANYCISLFSVWDGWREAPSVDWLASVVQHFYGFLRAVVLMGIELPLAVVDYLRGLFKGRNFWQELKFIPARVAICIVLRELVTAGVQADCVRGVPIIHANFLGYDEQAHRRGPSSRFAHWTLRGIDDAVRRIWKAARHSTRRDYTLWIYSDHGQEETTPFELATGRTIHQAVAETYARVRQQPAPGEHPREQSIQLRRLLMLRARREIWADGCPSAGAEPTFDRSRREGAPKSPSAAPPTNDASEGPVVAAMGPLGFVYLHEASTLDEKRAFARALVEEAGVPLVLVPDQAGTAEAFTATGVFRLPEDGAAVLGRDHPHLDEVIDDLVAIGHHPLAGDLALSGFRAEGERLSFPMENGSHAGPGPRETGAFAVLPGARLDGNQAPGAAVGRPSDLRQAVQRFFGAPCDDPCLSHAVQGHGSVIPETVACYPEPISIRTPPTPGHADATCDGRAGSPRSTSRLRVMTYNVHSCIGRDRIVSPQRIARVILDAAPDVVALQEVDVGRWRTEGVDQAEWIARALRMQSRFHPLVRSATERYGDAVLSSLPMTPVRAARLATHEASQRAEPRGALAVRLTLPAGSVLLVNTHLGLGRYERVAQCRALLGEAWLGGRLGAGPTIVCGDFNALPGSPPYRLLRRSFRDVQTWPRGVGGPEASAPSSPRQVAVKPAAAKTFPARYPFLRLDHVFVSAHFVVEDVEVLDSPLIRVASDHRPLVATLRLVS